MDHSGGSIQNLAQDEGRQVFSSSRWRDAKQRVTGRRLITACVPCYSPSPIRACLRLCNKLGGALA